MGKPLQDKLNRPMYIFVICCIAGGSMAFVFYRILGGMAVGDRYPDHQTPWQAIQRGLVESLDRGMTRPRRHSIATWRAGAAA